MPFGTIILKGKNGRIFIKGNGDVIATTYSTETEVDAHAQADEAYRRHVNEAVARISARVREFVWRKGDDFVNADYRTLTRARGYAVQQANNRNWSAGLDAVAAVIVMWIWHYDDVLFVEKDDPWADDEPFAQVLERVLTQVGNDIDHHFDKYGAQRLDLANWLMVIVEEEGEAVEEITAENWEEAKKEITQVIACWCRFYAEIEREQQGIADRERYRYVRAQ